MANRKKQSRRQSLPSSLQLVFEHLAAQNRVGNSSSGQTYSTGSRINNNQVAEDLAKVVEKSLTLRETGSNERVVEDKSQHAAGKRKDIVADWDEYWNSSSKDLQSWQRLMKDLGFEESFSSKTKCRKALKGVWVNIRDFLDAVKAGRPVRRFKSERELAEYTRKSNKRIYPRILIVDGSPLRDLLAHIRS